MPSALTNDASAAEIPTRREGNADTLVGKMDGVLRRAGTVITAAADKESSPPPVAEDRAVPKAAAGQETDVRGEKNKAKPNKHSMDYMMRSFVAGGLAGCAVCRLLSLLRLRLHL